MACTACLVCFISTDNGRNKNKRKEAKNALEDVALVAGTLQNLSNLYSLDIYGCATILFIVELPKEAKVSMSTLCVLGILANQTLPE
jgi:hypothetical protein